MPILAPISTIAARSQKVRLEIPGAPVMDGDGGFTQTWHALYPPALKASIQPATQRDLERLAAGTVLSTATHIAVMPFHPGITTKTRVTWTDRAGRLHRANVTGVDTPNGLCIDTVAVLAEIVT
jgi:head-tail adaptor